MGSEMCIRDRHLIRRGITGGGFVGDLAGAAESDTPSRASLAGGCLLYTSDAADERSSVDLGGRRIIKKKKSARTWRDDGKIRTYERNEHRTKLKTRNTQTKTSTRVTNT